MISWIACSNCKNISRQMTNKYLEMLSEGGTNTSKTENSMYSLKYSWEIPCLSLWQRSLCRSLQREGARGGQDLCWSNEGSNIRVSWLIRLSEDSEISGTVTLDRRPGWWSLSLKTGPQGLFWHPDKQGYIASLEKEVLKSMDSVDSSFYRKVVCL